MPSPIVIIGVLVCCVVVILSTVLGVYYSNSSCPGFGSDCSTPAPAATPAPVAAPTPAPTPAGTPSAVAAAPLATPLLASGQAIQVAEKTISVATPPTITTQPTGTSSGSTPNLSTLKYDFVGAGPCTDDVAAARTKCRTISGCDTMGQQTNGCWHCLKTVTTGGALPTAYTKQLISLSATTSTYMPQPFAMAVSNTAGTTSTYMPQPFAIAVSNVAGTTSTYTSESTCESIEGYSMY